jgi:pyruvate dehydrogenase E2 component (dihydrolipoyllysine-residue acetyltransferase)
MPTSVTMPALGESVTEGTVTRWLKQEGEQVEVDEPLLEVSTDKVDTEIPSPAAGVLTKILVSEDETVDVGAELAVIGGDGDGAAPAGGSDTSAAPAQQEEAPAQEAAPEPQPEPVAAAPSGGSGGDSGGGPGGEGTAVTMPALGESVTEGTVTRWLKSVGDEVTADEPLLEVSTDKVDTEIPAPVSGTLLSISVNEDETVEVGAELAVIGSGSAGGGEQAQAPAAPAQTETPAQPEPEQQEPEAQPQEAQTAKPASEIPGGDYGSGGALPTTSPTSAPSPAEAVAPQAPKTPAPTASSAGSAPTTTAPSGDGGGQYVTPLVRRLAADRGVDLSSVTGTGVGGRIRKQDVIAAAEKAAAPAEAPAAPAPAAASAGRTAPSPSPAAQPDTSLRGRTEKLSRLRGVIARRMVESLQVSAQLTTVVEADVTAIARLRDRAKRDFEAREGVKLSFLPFFAKAAVEALKAHPAVNSSIDLEAGTVTYHDAENLGVAVDTERGLLVPVIRDAGDLSIGGLARKIADLAERTRANKVTPDELGGGTFTLTNTGSRGALFDTPIINQPQVAILGLGTVVKRPVVVQDPDLGEVIAVRSMVYLALTYDHRIVDGADAARFLTTVKQRLEAGQFHGELGLA